MANHLSQYNLIIQHFLTDLKCHLFNVLNSSMFLDLFLDFICNISGLSWTVFHPFYSNLKVEHFAFGDVLEHKEMVDIAKVCVWVGGKLLWMDIFNSFDFETSRV